MARVVMIGIDGLDADLLRVYGPSLPHLRRLMLESPFLELKASFPPETESSWASVYTGLNPGNHGVWDGTGGASDGTNAEDYARNELGKHAAGNNTETAGNHPAGNAGNRKGLPLRGGTFWDMASEAGKRVCIINPLLAYPAWPVHGVMLSLPPVGIKGSGPSVTPEDISPIEPFPALVTSPVTPATRQLGDYCASLSTLTLQQVERGLELFRREPWDLFFLQLDALDHVQHVLWRYSDPSDPTYPGRNRHTGRILEFYRLFDQVIGRFRALMEPDCVLLVVSSHGHGRCCVSAFNLNEWLRQQGLLVPRNRSLRFLDRRYLAERAKHRSLDLLTHLRLQDTAIPLMPHIPHYLAGRLLPNYLSRLIDQQATVAQVVELARNSPFGGIRLNRTAIERNGDEYEQVRTSLLQNLSQVRLKGRPVVHWAKPREDVYQGKYLEHYPDILFELQNDFGVSSTLFTPLMTANMTHRLLSGDHRMYGVLLIGNRPGSGNTHVTVEEGEPTVMDVAPTVLRLLGVDVTNDECDGQALMEVPAGVLSV
jgi:predicted AlkP superfamily phosphohydrolase/phosphomutase